MNLRKIYEISLVLTFVLLLSSCSSVYTEIIIPAELKEVWNVLMDEESYKEWNPVLVPLEGEIIEGEKIKYQMTEPDGSQSENS